jgi:hypothetical protein
MLKKRGTVLISFWPRSTDRNQWTRQRDPPGRGAFAIVVSWKNLSAFR